MALTTSVEAINEMLAEHNIRPLTDTEVSDWGIKGGETNAELQELVNDYINDLHTEMCAEKNQWRYSQ